MHARRAEGAERDRLWARWAEVDDNLEAYAARRPGETAVVVRRGASAHAPCVCSLVSGAGMPLGEPVVRDTGLAKYAVASIVAKSRVMVMFDRARLFRLAGQG